MMRRYVLCVLFSMNVLYGSCTFGPSGINQWELLYQVANCVSSGSSGGSCSSLDSVSDVLGSKLDACCFSLSNLDRLILSDIDSVSSKVDALTSKSDTCCSVLDFEIRSVSDVLTGKVNQVDVVVTEIDDCLVGTAITQADIPLTITTPGKYIVCEDLSAASNLIDIQASNVILDLNGHTLESTTGICVTVNNVSHVVITNGFCTSALQSISVVTGSQDVTISDVHIYNSAEPAIHAIGTHGVTVSGCSIDGRNGTLLAFGMIRIDTCSEIVIEDSTIVGGNDFSSTPLAACVVTNPQSSEGGITIRRCRAEILNELGFSIDTDLTACLIEDCYVAQFIGTAKQAYVLSGGGSCELVRCIAASAGFGFFMTSYANVVLQDCTAAGCTFEGFRFSGSNGVADGCIANGNFTGFNITGSNNLLSFCKASANTTGFSITGSSTVLQQCVASGNSGSGIDNTTGTGTFIIDTRSSSLAPAYNLNGVLDVDGTATIVTF